MLDRLVWAGASLLATDAHGQTPLHTLCESACGDLWLAAAHLAEQDEQETLDSAEGVAAAEALATAEALAAAERLATPGGDWEEEEEEYDRDLSAAEEPEESEDDADAEYLLVHGHRGSGSPAVREALAPPPPREVGAGAATTRAAAGAEILQILDAAYARTLAALCVAAPLAMVQEDSEGRTPLCVLAVNAGLVVPNERPADGPVAAARGPSALGQHTPRATLQALCQAFGACFAACPTPLLHLARHSALFRDAAARAAEVLDADAPAPLRRLLDWIGVAMGGAWECAQDEWRYCQRALHDGTAPDVEELVESALRMNRLCERLDEQAATWRAEEAMLKLVEFRERCAQRARQFEDQIGRLEAEIAERSRLAQPQPRSGDAVEASEAARAVSGSGSRSAASKVGEAAGGALPPDTPTSEEEARAVVQAIRESVIA